MTELTGKKDSSTQSFSLKKIPVSDKNETVFDTEDNKYADKVKLLELSNLIDSWEKELLFDENGFFNLKGKDVRNKSKEYIQELEKFINSKMSSMTFSLENSKLAAKELRKIKTENIKSKLLQHEQKELYEWEISVYNNAILAAHDKALLYKHDDETVMKCIKNGINIISIMAKRESWKPKVLKAKKDKFISDCCFDIIKSFIDEKDLNSLSSYNLYSKYLIEEQRQELDTAISGIKNNIIAYNWAVELFSYNLDDKENEKEIKNLKDSNLETLVRKYLNILKKQKQKNEDISEKEKIRQSWDKIVSFLDTEPEKAFLYIDLTLDKDVIKAQKEYIKQIIGKGFIETDKAKFCELFDEMLNKFNEFKKQILSKYKHQLSETDFDFLEKLQSQNDTDYLKLSYDYKFLLEKLKKNAIKSSDKIYDYILNYRLAVEEYESVNEKKSDLEKRNKIINSILERNINK